MAEATVVTSLPDCDIHKHSMNTPGVTAAYDGATTMGPWANMCEPCFAQYGVGLGTGRGQRLLVAGSPEADAFTASKPTSIQPGMTLDEIDDLVGDGDIADYL